MIKPLLTLITIAAVTSATAAERVAGRADPAVFNAPPATFTPDIFGAAQKKDGVLRVLTVEERTGYARQNELVRVPLFFHDGECADPNALQIVPVGGGAPVPYQADDIRRDATGKVARMHVYFFTDLPAWGRKQFNLSAGKNPTGAALPVREQGDKATLGGDDIQVTFHSRGRLAGAIAGIETKAGKVTIPEQNFAPEAKLVRQNRKLATVRENAINYYTNPDGIIVKDLRWSSGPLFAKLILKLAPVDAPTDIAEYVYLIPKFGTEFAVTELLYPEEKDSSDTVGCKGNAVLTGKLFLGAAPGDQEMVAIPSGLRREMRSVFKYDTKALVNAKAGLSLAAIPYTQGGDSWGGIESDGRVFFCHPNFQTGGGSNSDALRVFWGQLRFIFSKATTLEELWQQSGRAFQPLTAVVDEPWATVGHFLEFNRAVGREFPKIQNWGRPFQANLAQNFYLDQNDAARSAIAKLAAPEDQELLSQIPTKEDIDAAWKKSQGAGGIDPWGMTYSTSMLVPMAAHLWPSPALDRRIELNAEASRLVNGRVDKYGWPHVRSFANALNMHVGTYMMGVYGGRKMGNRDLVQWCLDATQNQALLGVYGHCQRPYSMNTGGGGASDSLYQNTSDFWLRAIELTSHEDMAMHPGIYGRYVDAVDVNADLYQARISETGERRTTWWRAAFLRTQTHDHRWEAWATGPCLRMLADASDGGRIGLTEACYFQQRDVGRVPGYNDLSTVFLSNLLLDKALPQYRPAARPALPANVQVKSSAGKNVITWDAVKGDVAGYRIYRTETVGGPWTWLNSPHTKTEAFVPWTNAQRPQRPQPAKKGEPVIEPPLPEPYDFKVPKIPDTLVRTTSFTDPDGPAGALYFVTAQDKDGRESRWFPNEPLPKPGQ
jgi:hypothetical protein